MSTIKADTIKNKKSLAINLPNKLKIGGFLAEQGYTASGTEPSSPAIGDFWWDTANLKLYRYVNGEFKEFTLVAVSTANHGDKSARAGFGTANTSNVHTINIASLGNASSWKDLSRSFARGAAASNSLYGFFFGGNPSGSNGAADVNIIDYFAFANDNDATDFGDLTSESSDNSACASTERACIMLGANNSASTTYVNSIDYITMATPGNALDFGNLITPRMQVGANCSICNLTRGVFGGGYNPTNTNGINVIDYITMATTGNASDFGDLTSAGYGICGTGTGTGDRGLFAGGYPSGRYNKLEYITVSTTGNATSFGSLWSGTSPDYYGGASNNATRAIFLAPWSNNNIEYVTMATTGNAADFGDQVASSNNHFQACTSGNAS